MAQPSNMTHDLPSSMLSPLSAVLATPASAVEWLRLAPHPTVSHADGGKVVWAVLSTARPRHAQGFAVRPPEPSTSKETPCGPLK
jgi:hypothetical protein